MTSREALQNTMLAKGGAQRPLARLRNPRWIPRCRFLLSCHYCAVLKSEWQWPEPFQTTERRSILVMRKWKWQCPRSLTLTVSCVMEEQWSAPGNYGVGKQWHHHHETQNQGTSNTCTERCINQAHVSHPGFIPVLNPWKTGSNRSRKKGKSKEPKMKFKSLKWYFSSGEILKVFSNSMV